MPEAAAVSGVRGVCEYGPGCRRVAWADSDRFRSTPAGTYPSAPTEKISLSEFAIERLDGMSVSTRTRFEVFKRDGFTCQYCGRHRDEDGVKLHIDHVIPVKEGGGDEIENLVTACQDCNLGKAAKLLDDRAPVTPIEQRVHALVERRRRLEEYVAEKAKLDADVNRAWDYWFDVWGAETLPKYHCPWKSTIRSYVEALGVGEVCEAMDIVDDHFSHVSNDAVRYLTGVLKRKLAESEGRVVPCTHCGKRIVLTHEQLAGAGEGATWIHTACREQREAAKPQQGPTCQECGKPLEQMQTIFCDPCWTEWFKSHPVDEDEEEWGFEPDEIDLEVKAWDDLAERAGF